MFKCNSPLRHGTAPILQLSPCLNPQTSLIPFRLLLRHSFFLSFFFFSFPTDPTKVMAEKREGTSGSALTVSSMSSPPHRRAPTRLGNEAEEEKPVLFEARDDWHAATAKELSLAKGEVIRVLRQDTSGWWQGVSLASDRKGWFPADYVVPHLEAPPLEPPPPAAPSTSGSGSGTTTSTKTTSASNTVTATKGKETPQDEGTLNGQHHTLRHPFMLYPPIYSTNDINHLT